MKLNFLKYVGYLKLYCHQVFSHCDSSILTHNIYSWFEINWTVNRNSSTVLTLACTSLITSSKMRSTWAASFISLTLTLTFFVINFWKDLVFPFCHYDSLPQKKKYWNTIRRKNLASIENYFKGEKGATKWKRTN